MHNFPICPQVLHLCTGSYGNYFIYIFHFIYSSSDLYKGFIDKEIQIAPNHVKKMLNFIIIMQIKVQDPFLTLDG